MQRIAFILIGVTLLILFISCESAQHRRFNYFMSIQDNHAARSYLETEIRRNPGNAELHFLLGKVYTSERDFLSAKNSFNTVARITPQFDEDISFLLERHFRLELQSAMHSIEVRNYSIAVSHLHKAIEIDDSREEIYPMLGYAYLQLRQVTDSENAYKKAIELNHRNTGALYNIAELAFRKGDYATAVRFSERTLSIDERHISAYRLRAYSYLALRYFDEAEQSYEAFFQNSYSTEFRINFAIGLYNQGEYDRALPYLLSLVQYGNIDDTVIQTLGETYRYLERYREMAHWYEVLLRRKPDNPDIIKNLIYAYEMIGEKNNSEKYRELLRQKHYE